MRGSVVEKLGYVYLHGHQEVGGDHWVWTVEFADGKSWCDAAGQPRQFSSEGAASRAWKRQLDRQQLSRIRGQPE